MPFENIGEQKNTESRAIKKLRDCVDPLPSQDLVQIMRFFTRWLPKATHEEVCTKFASRSRDFELDVERLRLIDYCLIQAKSCLHWQCFYPEITIESTDLAIISPRPSTHSPVSPSSLIIFLSSEDIKLRDPRPEILVQA